MVATIADQGLWKAPSLVRYCVDQQGRTETFPDQPKQRVISPQSSALVRQLMEKVITEGSGQSAAVPEVPVAGKTGTSQTGILDEETTLRGKFSMPGLAAISLLTIPVLPL